MGKLADKAEEIAAKNALKSKVQNRVNGDTAELKRPSYHDDSGKMVSIDEAKKRRWARMRDGMPTKIYELYLAKCAAKKAGEPIPVRQWASKNPDQKLGDLQSPYNLSRRSGQRIIWQVLAEVQGKVLTRAELHDRVVAAYKAEYPEYYASKYTDDAPFDTWTTVIVMNRAPFNAKIEALGQRVEIDTLRETVTLLTNTEGPRRSKKRGRRSRETLTSLAVERGEVEPDTDSDNEIGAAAETPAEATA